MDNIYRPQHIHSSPILYTYIHFSFACHHRGAAAAVVHIPAHLPNDKSCLKRKCSWIFSLFFVPSSPFFFSLLPTTFIYTCVCVFLCPYVSTFFCISRLCLERRGGAHTNMCVRCTRRRRRVGTGWLFYVFFFFCFFRFAGIYIFFCRCIQLLCMCVCVLLYMHGKKPRTTASAQYDVITLCICVCVVHRISYVKNYRVMCSKCLWY